MKKENSNSGKPDLLLQKGEEKLNKKQFAKSVPLNDADTSKLIHELRVHQIELEIQNEKLRLAIDQEKAASAMHDFSPSGYFTLTRDGTICQLNLSGARILSKERTRLINKNFMQFVSHDTLPVFQNFVRMIFESHSKQTCEVWLAINGNPSIFVHIEGLISEDEQKCFVTAADITEHKKAELELLKEKNQLNIIFDTSPVSIWYKDTKNNFIRLNKAAAQIANRPVEEVEGHSADEIFPAESEKYYIDDLEVINSGKPKLGIIESATANGVTTWVRTDKLPWKDADGNIAGIIAFALDITDRIEAENKIRTSETRYRRLFESAKDGILILDAVTGQIVDVNPFLFQMLGYSPEELFGKELWEIGVFKNIADSKDAFIELQNKGYIRFDDMPLETKHGKLINVEFVSNVYLVDEVKVIQCNIRDITKRRRAEEALRQSEARLRTLVQTIPDLIWLKDKDGVYLSCNAIFERFFGASEAEIVGKTDYDFLDRELADFFREQDRKAMIAAKPTSNEEWITFADDGHRALLDTIKTPMYDSDGMLIGVLGISHDITERKQAEKEIKTLGMAIEQGPSSVVITDANGKIEFVNNKFTSLTQYQLEDVKGKNPRIFNPGRLPEKEYETLWKALQKGNTWNGEVLDHKKDKSLFWEEVNISAVMNPDGTIGNYILILNDITEKKQMLDDLMAAKEKAEEGNRLKSAFLSNMSHEIRTPMNAIMCFSALMKEAEGDEKNSYAEIVWNSSEKLLLLIDDVILLSRLQSEKMPVIHTGFSPAGLVTEVSRMINLPELKRKLDIKVNIPEQYKDLIMQSDATKIRLALTNLASNAVKYTPEGCVELGFDLHDGKVEFYVKDTGIGIPEQEKRKIFETFYRGKQAISSAIGGTGLGLCIARELVELLHGEIGLTSELNKGSRFYFTTPLEQGELGQSEKHSSRTVKKDWMDISILIADDEPVNFKYFETLLKGKVKNIDHAVNGKEAVEMASGNNYNLVLMDMKMPVMGGLEATKILKQRFPELSIIAQTAYTFPEEKEIAMQAGCDDFLTKPIKKGDLIEIINKYI